MASNDSMGDRLKAYEAASENVLIPRLPVILRLDGNSFSRFTEQAKFEKPFDRRFERAMEAAAKAVLQYCSGAQVAYIQSDEITILLRNDQTHQTTPFLANRSQKIASLTAATAAVAFNDELARVMGVDRNTTSFQAIFDCRAFVVPPAEVNNVFLWRQMDAFKNAVSSYAYWEIGKLKGRKTASKMLLGLSTAQRQELIFQELGVNFNDLPTEWKRGRCLVRETFERPLREVMEAEKLEKLVASGKADPDKIVTRSEWMVDREIPMFNLNRDYIERFLRTLVQEKEAA